MSELKRLQVQLKGQLQGVGFRPYIYGLAQEYRVHGQVANTPAGVQLEIEGREYVLKDFLNSMLDSLPPFARVDCIEKTAIPITREKGFRILPSANQDSEVGLITPDLATCEACLKDVFNPHNRRYLYPFTNCTQCGPRYTILHHPPYDRENTVMQRFPLCDDCRKEYESPRDRRFHAQPIACPQCGPKISFHDEKTNHFADLHHAFKETVQRLTKGQIIAVKGLGGFHLIADAYNQKTITRLRLLKERPLKPFAVMYPDVELLKKHCSVNLEEERLLLSPNAPIVLVKKRHRPISVMPVEGVAPNSPYLGVMLPYTPLHHMLIREMKRPLVATSGNLHDESLCYQNEDAFERLKGLVNGFLVHDRDILTPVDDSIVQVMAERPLILRRARGYVPQPIPFHRTETTILALGAQLKNTIAVHRGDQIITSQHHGNLDDVSSFEVAEQTLRQFQRNYRPDASITLVDKHPEYAMRQLAERGGLQTHDIQHHVAHLAACMADNQLEGDVLGVCWDGTGYGSDGVIWGGEFIRFKDRAFQRMLSWLPFPLPGGDAAVMQPRRVALGLMWVLFGEKLPAYESWLNRLFQGDEWKKLLEMIEKDVNCPRCCSVGRLFDGVASLLDLRQQCSYEAQAAIELETRAAQSAPRESYPYQIGEVIDWRPMIKAVLRDSRAGKNKAMIAANFQQTLVSIIVEVVGRFNIKRVALTGGCFQNKWLLETAIKELQKEDHEVFWHLNLPPNDGCIAPGQLAAHYFRNPNS